MVERCVRDAEAAGSNPVNPTTSLGSRKPFERFFVLYIWLTISIREMKALKNFKTGLCSVSFRRNTPEEIAKAAHDAGLEFIEWASDAHAPCDDAAKIENIIFLQNQYGITCSSYGTYYKIGQHTIDDIYPYIKTARMLGTNILRLWCGVKSSSLYSAEEKEALLDTCRQLAAVAKDEDVIFCMEYHNNTFTDSPDTAMELMQTVSSPNFRMYWQPEAFISADENDIRAEMLAPYSVNIHVFNHIKSKAVPLSECLDSWKQYLSHFDGEKVLLLEFLPNNSMDSLKAEAESLRTIVMQSNR